MNWKNLTILTLFLLVFVWVFFFLNPFTPEDEITLLREMAETKLNQVERQKPPHLSIEYLRSREYGGGEITVEERVTENSNFTSFVVSYFSDGLKQYALMNVPKTQREKFPVVIVNHGYINPQIYSTTGHYTVTSAFYSTNGFLVLKPDYRGHAKSEDPNDGSLNRLGYAVDVLNLIYSLDSLPQADTDNIFMYGHSMGGDVTLRVIEATNKVKAASLWAPVAQEFPESFMYFVRRSRTYAEISEIERQVNENYRHEDFPKLTPLNYLHLIKAELYIHHGTADDSVPYFWSSELAKKLEESGVNYQLFTYQGADHNIAQNFTQAASYDLELFRRHFSDIY